MRTALLILAIFCLAPALGHAEDIADEVLSGTHDARDFDTAAPAALNAFGSRPNCAPHKTAEQCAAEFSIKIAQTDAALSKSLAKSLAKIAVEDEKVLQEQEAAKKEIADLERQMANLQNERNRVASQDPTAGQGNSSGGNSSGGNKGGGQKGGGASGGGSPAQLAALQPGKGNELDRAGENAAAQRPNDITMDLASAGTFQNNPVNFGDPMLPGTYEPTLSGNPNRSASTSADLSTNGGRKFGGLLGKLSALAPIAAKAANAAIEAAKAGGGGGSAPGISGAGGAKSDTGGPPPIGEQELEPAPPKLQKVPVEFAAASGPDGGTNAEGNEGDGNGDKPSQQVAPPRTQLAQANQAGTRGEKRTGHGILDYMGYITDSCHDKTETLLTTLCTRGRPVPVGGGVTASASPATAPSTDAAATRVAAVDGSPITSKGADVPGAVRDLASLPSGDAVNKLALAPATASVGSPVGPAARAGSEIVKDGLERAFSRRLPDQSL